MISDTYMERCDFGALEAKKAKSKQSLNPYKRTITAWATVDGQRRRVEVAIDWYNVAAAYEMSHPVAHAGKKLAGSGTGEKSRLQELREAIAAIEREIEDRDLKDATYPA